MQVNVADERYCGVCMCIHLCIQDYIAVCMFPVAPHDTHVAASEVRVFYRGIMGDSTMIKWTFNAASEVRV